RAHRRGRRDRLAAAAPGRVGRGAGDRRLVSAAPSITRPLRRGAGLRAQALPAVAQVASGAGNLVFALAAARLLAPGAFADLAAFLALYLVVHVPAASLSAGGAL